MEPSSSRLTQSSVSVDHVFVANYLLQRWVAPAGIAVRRGLSAWPEEKPPDAPDTTSIQNRAWVEQICQQLKRFSLGRNNWDGQFI